MKKNNKGFMLVEVIIVTVIVATIMTSLYVAFVRVYKVYDIKDKYSNVDGIYALNMIMDYYVDNITINNIINDSKDNIINLKNNTSYCSIVNNINYCDNINKVIEKYNINSLYVINIDKLNDLKNQNISNTFKDYLSYLDNTLDKENNKVIFLVELTISSEDNIYNYAYLNIDI